MMDLETQVDTILALPHDWDGEGSPAYDRVTIDKALKLIPLMKEKMQQEKKITAGDPNLGPGPKGSIDVHWKTERYQLLMNVPPSGPANYYGDDGKGSDSMKGELTAPY